MTKVKRNKYPGQITVVDWGDDNYLDGARMRYCVEDDKLTLAFFEKEEDAHLFAKLISLVTSENKTKRPEWPLPGSSAEDTLRAVIRNCAVPPKSARTKTEPRWSIVSKVTAHGSTYSTALCRWADLNPDDLVRRRT